MKSNLVWIVLFFICISIAYSDENISQVTYDLSILSNMNYQIYINQEYDNLFKIKNNNYPQISGINISARYNITKSDTYIFYEDYFNLTNINSYKTSGTGKYTFNETGNYTICGEIINSTINDSNFTNYVCFDKTVIDSSAINCELSLNISSDEVFNDTIKFKFELNNNSFLYNITYYVTDLFDNILKYPEVTQNTNSKTFTPNDDLQAYIIRASVSSYCNDTNQSNNNISKMIFVRHTDLEEEPDPDSYIDVGDIYLGTDEKAKFGSTFRVAVSIYKGETTNNSIIAYVQDEIGNKISSVTSFNLYDNYAFSDFTIPILLDSNCDDKLPNREYYLIIEGIGAMNSEIINISGKETCQTITKECKSTSSKSSTGSLTISNSKEETQNSDEENKITFPKKIFANQEFEISFDLENTKNSSQNYSIYSYAYKANKAYSQSRDANAINITLLPYEIKNITLKDKVFEQGIFSYKVRIYREGIKTPKEMTDTIYVESNEKSETIENVMTKGIVNDKAVLNVKVSGGDSLVVESLSGDITKNITTRKTFDVTVPAQVYDNVYYLVLYDNNSVADFTRIEVTNDNLDNTTNYKNLYSKEKTSFAEEANKNNAEVTNEKTNSDNTITGNVVYKSPKFKNRDIAIYFLLALMAIVTVYFIIQNKYKSHN